MLQPLLGNLIAASQAITPFPLVDPRESRDDPGAFGLTAFLHRQRHGLLLHRIHPAEPSDTVLLKRNRPSRFFADPVFFIQLGQPGLKL